MGSAREQQVSSPQSGEPKDGRIDWAYVYGRIITATGWTFEYVGQTLTLPEAFALFKYWSDHPPVNESVQALLKARAKGEPASETKRDDVMGLAQGLMAAGLKGTINRNKKSKISEIPKDHPALKRMQEQGIEIG